MNARRRSRPRRSGGLPDRLGVPVRSVLLLVLVPVRRVRPTRSAAPGQPRTGQLVPGGRRGTRTVEAYAVPLVRGNGRGEFRFTGVPAGVAAPVRVRVLPAALVGPGSEGAVVGRGGAVGRGGVVGRLLDALAGEAALRVRGPGVPAVGVVAVRVAVPGAAALGAVARVRLGRIAPCCAWRPS